MTKSSRSPWQFRRALHGSLHVAHAFVPIPDDVTASELLNKEVAKTIEKRARLHARERLDQTLERAKLRLGRGRRHLLDRHPVNAHSRAGEAAPLGHRRDGRDLPAPASSAFLIGNTAERIIDELACDVLVVKPKEFVSRVPQKGRGMRVGSPPQPMPY